MIQRSPKIRVEDLKAWIKKYFKVVSELYWLDVEEIIGIKESKLISRPIQIISQDDDDTEIIIPAIKDIKNKIFDLEVIIKKRV